MLITGSEMRFKDLPVGQLYCHIIDARSRAPLTSRNVYQKISGTKYQVLTRLFTGKHRFPSVNVCIVSEL